MKPSYICEAYLKKYPVRIGFLRMANVSANSDVPVVDMVGGLLSGSVAERLGVADISPLFYRVDTLKQASLQRGRLESILGYGEDTEQSQAIWEAEHEN
ncbi:hypothetical protein ACLB2K_012299 [Fragaria x ananassa]